MLDGCTRWQALRRVMIPLMGPGILTAGIFMFLFAFQEYLTALGPHRRQRQDGAGLHRHPARPDAAHAAAGGGCSMLLTLPVIAIAFIAQKYLVAGLNSGSVKG